MAAAASLMPAPAIESLLVSLRLGPMFLFAPPFSLMRIPARVRVVCVLGCATALAALARPVGALSSGQLLSAMAGELLLGAVIAFSWQAAFAGLLFAGRVLDLQAGFGMALIIDPATRAQTPLFGTLLALGGGVVFFAGNVHHEVLRLLAALNEWLPPGSMTLALDSSVLASYLGKVMSVGLVTTAVAIVVLFLIDLALAFLSRVLPQMNVLMLGLQVKSIVSVLVLGLSLALLGPVMVRLSALAASFVPHLLGAPR